MELGNREKPLKLGIESILPYISLQFHFPRNREKPLKLGIESYFIYRVKLFPPERETEKNP